MFSSLVMVLEWCWKCEIEPFFTYYDGEVQVQHCQQKSRGGWRRSLLIPAQPQPLNVVLVKMATKLHALALADSLGSAAQATKNPGLCKGTLPLP